MTEEPSEWVDMQKSVASLLLFLIASAPIACAGGKDFWYAVPPPPPRGLTEVPVPPPRKNPPYDPKAYYHPDLEKLQQDWLIASRKFVADRLERNELVHKSHEFENLDCLFMINWRGEIISPVKFTPLPDEKRKVLMEKVIMELSPFPPPRVNAGATKVVLLRFDKSANVSVETRY